MSNALGDVLIRDGSHVKLTDLDAATYLFLKRVSLVDAVEVSRSRRRSIYEIIFYDPDHRAEQLVIEFVNSECARYANAQGRLKSVIHRFHSHKPTNGTNGKTTGVGATIKTGRTHTS